VDAKRVNSKLKRVEVYRIAREDIFAG